MELSIHYLMSYDFLIVNTSTGESKYSCLHVYQACYLKFACMLCTYVNFNIDIASHFFQQIHQDDTGAILAFTQYCWSINYSPL